MNLTLDLTPWLRGPYSGVGLTALHSGLALATELKESTKFKLRFVRKDQKIDSALEKRLGKKIDWLNPFRRWSGMSDEIFHSFALQLPELRHSRRVVTVHDCWTLKPNEYQDKKFQKVQSRKLVHAIRHAHAIVVPTQAVRSQLTEWDASLLSKTHVVHWGATLEGVAENTQTFGAIDLPIPLRDYFLENRPYALVVANIENRKNHHLIFQAMKNMKGLDLILAGESGFGAEQILEEMGDIPVDLRIEHFSDLDVRSLASLYDRATVVVSASKDEGFGLPVLEAMTRGKPVLLSKISAHDEIAGGAALYFDPVDGAPELREYLETLKSDPYVQRDLSERGQKRAKLFSWEFTAQKLIEIYEKLSH